MAKLGSEKKPAIVHVRNEHRAEEVSSIFNKNGWRFIIGIEPDKPEDISDLEKLLNPPKPVQSVKIGRNDPCPCGSGRKYKKCCLNKPKSDSLPVKKRDELDVLMEKGMSLLQRNKTAKACDVWLELWTYLKRRFKPEFRDVEEAETIFSGCEFISNYCQDLEIELGNAGVSDPVYYQKRIAYCDEFCSIFPESDELLMHNMKRAIAESNFALGNIDESDNCFKELIELYPRNIWGYIGWGDMYLWSMKNDIKPDYERAEQIYKMALGKDIEGEKALIDRLNALKKERDKKAKQ